MKEKPPSEIRQPFEYRGELKIFKNFWLKETENTSKLDGIFRQELTVPESLLNQNIKKSEWDSMLFPFGSKGFIIYPSCWNLYIFFSYSHLGTP